MGEAATISARQTVRVWDPLQRLLHWALVLAVAVSWWAGEGRLSVHIAAGYAVMAIASLRIVWGFVGPRHARFSSFVQRPVAVSRHAHQLVMGTAHRFLGHNPLGAWMVLAMLCCLGIVCASGVAYTTDRFWGLAWLEDIHRVSSWTLVGLIAVHLIGVAVMSWRHQENLVAAMWSGRKRVPHDG